MERKQDDSAETNEQKARVLVIDDDNNIRTLYRLWLSKQFEIESVGSGSKAIEICKQILPDLVLLDVMMPGIDGYETCRRLREFTDIPIIFVTANESLEEQLKTFDAGGDDVIIKPMERDLLLRTINLAIQQKNKLNQLKTENDSMQNLTMNYLSAIGEQSGVQRFMQASLNSLTLNELGLHLVEAIHSFGLENCVLIRGENGATILTSHGEASTIEKSILEQSDNVGKIFQLKQRLVINCGRISILVSNMYPEESEQSVRIRDKIIMLVEMSQSMCDNMEIRQTSALRSESVQVALQTAYQESQTLNEMRHQVHGDLRILMQELMDNIEKTYSWLGIGQTQEAKISNTMYESVEKVFNLLETSGDRYDSGFEKVLLALRSENLGGKIHLF